MTFLMGKWKVIGNEPKDNDWSVLIISIVMILIAWVVLGLTLYLTKQEIAQSLATIILATITLIAVFYVPIKNWWERPKFGIFFGTKEPFVIENGKMRYTRAKIRNFGRGSAKECFVRVNQILKADNGDVAIGDLPINLKWSSAPKNKITEVFEEKKEIPSNGGRAFVDILTLENTLSKNMDKGAAAEYLRKPYELYLLGNLGEKRHLDLEAPDLFGVRGHLDLKVSDYLLFITIHSKNDYSKSFVLDIKNAFDPTGIKISLAK